MSLLLLKNLNWPIYQSSLMIIIKFFPRLTVQMTENIQEGLCFWFKTLSEIYCIQKILKLI